MRKAAKSAGRGVYVAPWIGDHGEVVLLAISQDRKLIGDPLVVPLGGNHVEASDALWARIEAENPIPNLRVI